MRAVLRAALVMLAALSPLPDLSAAYAPGSCLSRQAQRQAIETGEVMRPGRLGRRLGGKVLRLRLCHSGGGLIWRVTVLGGDGRVVAHVVDARSGAVLQ